ncbi:hypothetical protein IJ384_01810 [bacterium]|nr:hypothetical protein [bacterium]
MGMAASQARYLALVARKSNCEYEGQQINQARTALSNQSANLFNQMLGLSVPVPPSTQDFTKIQYSYKDGINASTIDSWQQLATPEEDYNYVVTHHYYTDVYTGSQKKLSDPQVQFSKGLTATPAEMDLVINTLTSTRVEYDKVIEEYNKIMKNHEAAVKANDEAVEAYNVALQLQQEAEAAVTASLNEYTTAKNASEAYKTNTYDPLETAKNNAENAYNNAIEESKNLSSYQNETSPWSYDVANPRTKNNDGSYSLGNDKFVPVNQLEDTDLTGKNITLADINNSIQALKDIGALPANFDTSNAFITINDSTPALAFKEDLDKVLIATIDDTLVPRYDINPALDTSVTKKVEQTQTNIGELENTYTQALNSFSIAEAEYNGLLTVENEKLVAYNTAQSALDMANMALATANTNKETAAANLATAEAEKTSAETDYGPTIKAYEEALEKFESISSPEYIGNCELEILETLTTDQLAEIRQIVTDMKNQEVDASINNCFDADGNYIGGIYSFKMNGINYFTTYSDLHNSYVSGTGNNHIDGQIKMNYYNATYVSTKIEETEKALLETDEYGRFSSIRFENDSVKYTLSMETITDDAAYQDAMNQYYYENAKYDKTIQDINAKTSIIQQQDQQLELRLKQLDTEQKALSTEMDAVKKVVDDNIDKSFKTFGG